MQAYKGKLYCFSPPVMLATIAVETALLVYALWRYRLTLLTRVVVAMLFLLALFQLSEYNVCGGMGVDAATWSRVGFAAITLLPPLGIHLIHIISKHRFRFITWVAYTTAVIWEAVFLLSNRAFSGHVCAGNYVIFQLSHYYVAWYFVYYYFWLFVGVGLCLYFAYKTTRQHIKRALILQNFGYLVFLLPTAIANTVSPSTISGIPSVMCGFAVLYALVLVIGIVPIFTNGEKQHVR
jgi:hypothetical protein